MACVRIKSPLKYPLCPSKFPLKLNAHSDTTDQAPTKHRSTTDQAQEIILSMSEYYMTMNEIMTSMRLKHRTSFREKYFLPALEDGAIEHCNIQNSQSTQSKNIGSRKWIKNG